MSKISMFMLVIGLVIGIAGVALFLYGTPGIQSVETVTSVGTSQDSDGNSSGDGIQVHGDWELTVSDPDGSNAVVYNFENSLIEGGFFPLAFALAPVDHASYFAVRSWQISFWQTDTQYYPPNIDPLYDPTHSGPGFSPDGYFQICAASTDPSRYEDDSLRYSHLQGYGSTYGTPGNHYSDLPSNGFILAGSCFATEVDGYIAGNDTGEVLDETHEIKWVRSAVLLDCGDWGNCLSSLPAAAHNTTGEWNDDPYAPNGWGFTAKYLDPPVVVKPGQVISANVKITFE